MKEKLRFRVVSEVKFPELEEFQIQKVSESAETEREERLLSVPVYDVLLSAPECQFEAKKFSTELKEVAKKPIFTPIFDVQFTQRSIKPISIPNTELVRVQIPRPEIKVFDVNLLTSKFQQFPVFNTELKSVQSTLRAETSASIFDILLKPREILKQNIELDTSLSISGVFGGVESTASSQMELPIFEGFIKCDKKIPRGFSETFNSPLVMLVGEDSKEWHIPIIYVLRELFREVTDKFPRITFREPEIWEEGYEESVDSTEPHSLEQFAFENKIEFLDARRRCYAIEEFAKIVKGRIKSSFLQQFGVLVVAVRSNDLDRAKKALESEGLRIYACKPDDEYYEIFCSKVLGLEHPTGFFDALKEFERCLESTFRQFSVFVKRGADATDRFQYPLKVATFVYLLNDIISRRKKLISNFEELCRFIKEIGGIIRIEEQEGGIIPDITYSPDGEKICIEIETLIGTIEPLKKVDETIEKYKENCRIWVVLRPVSALLHYEELKTREKVYNIVHGKNVEFKVLTLSTAGGKFKWSLVSIDKFLRKREYGGLQKTR